MELIPFRRRPPEPVNADAVWDEEGRIWQPMTTNDRTWLWFAPGFPNGKRWPALWDQHGPIATVRLQEVAS